jgi:hypothetical protein
MEIKAETWFPPAYAAHSQRRGLEERTRRFSPGAYVVALVLIFAGLFAGIFGAGLTFATLVAMFFGFGT